MLAVGWIIILACVYTVVGLYTAWLFRKDKIASENGEWRISEKKLLGMNSLIWRFINCFSASRLDRLILVYSLSLQTISSFHVAIRRVRSRSRWVPLAKWQSIIALELKCFQFLDYKKASIKLGATNSNSRISPYFGRYASISPQDEQAALPRIAHRFTRAPRRTDRLLGHSGGLMNRSVSSAAREKCKKPIERA